MNLESKIQVRREDATLISLKEWQEMYNISGRQIGRNFSYLESRFYQDIQEYDCLEVNAPLMMVLDAYREAKGKAVNINSYNRDAKKQQRLKELGYKTAKYSPHVVKLAADVDTITKSDTIESVQILKDVSESLCIPIRLGYSQYLRNNQTFIHIDVCPLYFGVGKVWHHLDHPKVWETEREW